LTYGAYVKTKRKATQVTFYFEHFLAQRIV